MRAIQVAEFGPPEVLTAVEVPEPAAGPGELVIDVAAVDTIFVETQIRWGRVASWFSVEPPYVPGGGVAGRVRSVGAGVDPGWVGRRVAAHTGATGGYAEQVAAPAANVAEVPDGLGLREAAALTRDGRTATGLLDGNPLGPRDRVLILGAAGGMGVLLVQLARAAGAQVVGAARGKRKLDVIRELGADEVVDYSEPGWPDRVRDATGGAGPTVVFDGVGGRIGRDAYELTARGGRFSAHGAPSGGFTEIDPDDAARRGVTVRGIADLQYGPAEGTRRTGRALAEAAAGRIAPFIGRTYPLERAADAHAAIEAREVVGKALLLP